MCKRHFVFFIVTILLLSGCTKVSNNLDEVVDAAMVNNDLLANTVSTGYELYIPTGVKQVADRQYNQKFKIKNRYIYLYVDTISYYYKELQYDGKSGYIGIRKTNDDLYFCEIVYNYSKMEFYAELDELSLIVANSLIIQKSIKYNDSLISLELENRASDGVEVTYELDSPKDSKSVFSDYLQDVVEDETDDELPEENWWWEV